MPVAIFAIIFTANSRKVGNISVSFSIANVTIPSKPSIKLVINCGSAATRTGIAFIMPSASPVTS